MATKKQKKQPDPEAWRKHVTPGTGCVCLSGGKDSTAMLFRMLEMNKEATDKGEPEVYPITRIIFADTGFEFPQLYDYFDEIQAYLDKNYPNCPKVEILKPGNASGTGVGTISWHERFYGKITRGKAKGRTRGAPLQAYPCWWARDSKIEPLEKAHKTSEKVYIGIAADESHRMTKDRRKQGRYVYPLVDWNWSEDMCHDYLDSPAVSMVNPLYTQYRRLGCFHCIKQPLQSWHSTWQNHPDLWEKSKYWDRESIRISGHSLRQDFTLEELEARFEAGFIPKGKGVYECSSCDAVKFNQQDIVTKEDFDDGDLAPEQYVEGYIENNPDYDKSHVEWEQVEEDLSCDVMDDL